MLLIKQIWKTLFQETGLLQTKETLELNGSVSENLSILSSGHNFALSCLEWYNSHKRMGNTYIVLLTRLTSSTILINPGLQEMFPV